MLSHSEIAAFHSFNLLLLTTNFFCWSTIASDFGKFFASVLDRYLIPPFAVLFFLSNATSPTPCTDQHVTAERYALTPDANHQDERPRSVSSGLSCLFAASFSCCFYSKLQGLPRRFELDPQTTPHGGSPDGCFAMGLLQLAVSRIIRRMT